LPFFGQNCSLPFSLRILDIPALLKSWKKHYVHSYIKSFSHEVAKHKSGVICQFHLTMSDGITFSHIVTTFIRKMVMQSVFFKVYSFYCWGAHWMVKGSRPNCNPWIFRGVPCVVAGSTPGLDLFIVWTNLCLSFIMFIV
jgi:hypothetical protein